VEGNGYFRHTRKNRHPGEDFLAQVNDFKHRETFLGGKLTPPLYQGFILDDEPFILSSHIVEFQAGQFFTFTLQSFSPGYFGCFLLQI
jgi:hypothetical protein